MDTSVDNTLLMARGSPGLLGRNETRADPNGLRAKREGHGQTTAVVNAAGSDDVKRPTGQR